MKSISKIVCFFAFLGLHHASAKEMTCYISTECQTIIAKDATFFLQQLQKAGNFSFKLISSDKADIRIATVNSMDNGALHNQQPEAAFINCTAEQLTIIGNTPLAASEAMFSYLFMLGFRYYFPNPAWYISPKLSTIFKPVSVRSQPSYEQRRILYAYGTDSKQADADYQIWTQANRLGGSMPFNAGHAYGAIVNRNKAAFSSHPEYFAAGTAVDEAAGAKFDVSNEGLVQVCINDALTQLKTLSSQSDFPMVSIEPSDGTGACNTPACLKIGDEDAQAYYLANRVARAVQASYPNAWVGMYAYNNHIAPPPFDLARNIMIYVATAYNNSRYTQDELLDLWRRKAARLGVREYYGVMAWDWDMPGQPRGSKVDYVARTLRRFRQKGATALIAETNIGWMSRGLGHYAAAQLMWDTSLNTEELRNEFFERCFGPVASLIRPVYDDWEHYTQATPADNDLARWIEAAQAARAANRDPQIAVRLDQLGMYLHCVSLYKQYRTNTSETTFLPMMRFAYRVQSLGVYASYPLARRLVTESATYNPAYSFKNKNAPWKQSSMPPDAAEIGSLLQADRMQAKVITGIKVFPESAIKLGTEVAIARKSAQKAFPAPVLRGGHLFYLHVTANAPSIQVAGGFVAVKDMKGIDFSFFKGGDMPDPSAAAVAAFRVPASGGTLLLKGITAGNYWVNVEDYRGGFSIDWGNDCEAALSLSTAHAMWALHRNSGYIFVPKGVTKFLLHKNGSLTLTAPGGAVTDGQDSHQELLEISVSPADAGKCWQISSLSGRLWAEGIPAWFFTDPARLVLP